MDSKNNSLPIYLHFLNRELRRAEGVTYTDLDIIHFLIVAVFCSDNYLYSSSSLLQESSKEFPQTTQTLLELEKYGFLKLLTNEYSFDEFIQSRREIYAHKESRYPMYFDDVDESLWPKDPILVTDSTTSILRGSLNTWLDNPYRSNGPDIKHLSKDNLNTFSKTLYEQKEKAISLDLLLDAEEQNNILLNRNLGRLISFHYTKRYLDLFGGDIICNLPRLTFYDPLSPSKNLKNYLIIHHILKFCSVFDYFIDSNSFIISKFVEFICEPSFLFLKQEINILNTSIIHSNCLRDFIRSSQMTAKKDQLHLPTKDFLMQSYSILSNVGLNLSNKEHEFSKQYFLAKQEINAPKKVLVAATTLVEAKCFLKAMESIGYTHSIITINKLTFWNFGILNNIDIFMLKIPDMGSSSSSASTLVIHDAIPLLKPDYIIMLGIAFGLKKASQKLGDILVSKVLENYNSAKVTPQGIIQRGNKIPCGPTLLNRFDSSSVTYSKHTVDVGLFISGDLLVDNENLVIELKKSFPDAIGGEMEGTGLQAASNREGVEWIVIKGICDFGFDKQTPEKERDQVNAINNVCDYFIYTLQNYPI
ncbi:MAG: hypothetical protein WC716_04275 [Chitinophagaceae bacterium]|jgi:nucleoside phosphorylase